MNWFIETFEQNGNQISDSGQIFITKGQFESAVNEIEIVNDQEQVQHLLSLYGIADPQGTGKISREDLL